jgi:outer membrane protein
MQSRILFLIFLTVMCRFLPLHAQEKWSLNQCIQFALENNLNLQEAGINSEQAGLNFNQTRWNMLPAIGAGTDAGKNFGRSIDPATNNYVNTAFFNNSYYLSASVDLFRGFIYQNQIRYRAYKKDASESSRVNAADDVAFAVMDAFFNVIFYEELLKIANDQKALSEQNVRKILVMIDAGLKSQADLLEVKANYEKEELFCVQTINNIATSRIGLKKAMNLPSERELVLLMPAQAPDSSAMVQDISELYRQHTNWSPYIKSFEQELLASQKNVSISKGGFSPSIRLQASYNTGFYETNKDQEGQVIDFSDQINNNQRQFVGASLSIPIFSKNTVRYNVQTAKIEARMAQTRLSMARQTLLYEMERNFNELNASAKELQQAEKQQEADKLAFVAAQKKFDQGMITAIELNTTKNRLANSAAQVLHANLMYELKKRVLGFYRGNRFWENGT